MSPLSCDPRGGPTGLFSFVSNLFLFFRVDGGEVTLIRKLALAIGKFLSPDSPPITFFSNPASNHSTMAQPLKDDSSSAQPVVFTTQTTYLLPAQKFMIPMTWKRYQLSQLVNKALSLTTPVPFDFLVRGEILRGSLMEWCHEKGVGEVRSMMSVGRPPNIHTVSVNDSFACRRKRWRSNISNP